MSTIYSLPAESHPRASPYEQSSALGLDLGPPSPDPIVPYHSRSPPISPITPVARPSFSPPIVTTTPVDPVLVDATGSPRVSVRRLVVDFEEHDRQIDEEAERERAHHHASTPGLAPARRLRSGSASGSSTSSQHGHGRHSQEVHSPTRSRAPVNAEGRPYVSGSINHSKSARRRYSRAAELRDQVSVDGVSPPSPPKSTRVGFAADRKGEEVPALVCPENKIGQESQDEGRPEPNRAASMIPAPASRIPTPSRSKSATTVPSFTSSSSTPSSSSRGSSAHPSPSIPSTPPHTSHGLPHTPSPASSVDAREAREPLKRNSSFTGFGSLRGLRSLRKGKGKDAKHANDSVLHFDHPEPIQEDSTKHRPEPLDLRKDPGYRKSRVVSAYDFLASESPLDSVHAPVSTSPTKKRMSLGNIFHRKEHKGHKDHKHEAHSHEPHKEPRKSLSIPLIERRPSAQFIRAGTVSSAVAAVENAPVQYVIDASGVHPEPITHTHTVIHTVSTPPSPPTTPPKAADVAKPSSLTPSPAPSFNSAPPPRKSSLSPRDVLNEPSPKDALESDREAGLRISTDAALTDEPATSDSICSDAVEHFTSSPPSPLRPGAPFILVSTPPTTDTEIPIGEALALEPSSPETKRRSPPASEDIPLAEFIAMSAIATTSIAVEPTPAPVAAAEAPAKSLPPAVAPTSAKTTAAAAPHPTDAAPAPAPAEAAPGPTVEVTVKTTSAPTSQPPAEPASAAAPVAAPVVPTIPTAAAPPPAIATAPVAAVVPVPASTPTPAHSPSAPVVAVPITVVPVPVTPQPKTTSTPAPAAEAMPSKGSPRTPDTKAPRSTMPPRPHKPATPAPSDRITEKITTVEVSLPAGTPADEVERMVATARADADAETTPTPTPKKSSPVPGSKAGIKPIAMVDYAKFMPSPKKLAKGIPRRSSTPSSPKHGRVTPSGSPKARPASTPAHKTAPGPPRMSPTHVGRPSSQSSTPSTKTAPGPPRTVPVLTPAHRTSPGAPVRVDVGNVEITVGPSHPKPVNPQANGKGKSKANKASPVPPAALAPEPASEEKGATEITIAKDAAGTHVTLGSSSKAAAPKAPSPPPPPPSVPAPAPAEEAKPEVVVTSGNTEVTVSKAKAAKETPAPPPVPAPSPVAAPDTDATKATAAGVNITINVEKDTVDQAEAKAVEDGKKEEEDGKKNEKTEAKADVKKGGKEAKKDEKEEDKKGKQDKEEDKKGDKQKKSGTAAQKEKDGKDDDKPKDKSKDDSKSKDKDTKKDGKKRAASISSSSSSSSDSDSDSESESIRRAHRHRRRLPSDIDDRRPSHPTLPSLPLPPQLRPVPGPYPPARPGQPLAPPMAMAPMPLPAVPVPAPYPMRYAPLRLVGMPAMPFVRPLAAGVGMGVGVGFGPRPGMGMGMGMMPGPMPPMAPMPMGLMGAPVGPPMAPYVPRY